MPSWRGVERHRGARSLRLALIASGRYMNRMNAFSTVLIVVAMLTTLGVLFAGLIAMARGGDFNRKYGNRLMRWRVMAQFTAIVIFAIAMLINQG